MKKDVILYIALLLVGLVFEVSQAEAGRLNFMLVNMTNDDIVNVTICPTYAPKNFSKNLLNTHVDPNTRLYIGHNLYGHQRYWNINVTWANGLKRTFTHQRLTKYNTYLMYSTPHGVGIRQRYERVFARYEGVPAFSDAARSSCEGYGIAEKENVAEKSAFAFMQPLRKDASASAHFSKLSRFCDNISKKCHHVTGLRVVADVQNRDVRVFFAVLKQSDLLKDRFLSLGSRNTRSCIGQGSFGTGDTSGLSGRVCSLSNGLSTSFVVPYRSPPLYCSVESLSDGIPANSS